MIVNERQSREDQVVAVAKSMMAAARTAPKGKGIDNLEIAMVCGKDELETLATRMKELSDELGYKFFLRDADNVINSQAIVFIGTKIETIGMNCGLCGYLTCEQKQQHPLVPCAFNMNDMGIALGSAAAIAADNRIDTRIMYSAGLAAKSLDIVEGCHAVFAILMSCSGKSPYFDRVVNK